ncbi:MAG: hypothetical protein KKD28_03135 [Chloroflexi bacterium]|nr:hypothetical protein [Chloroflexota bacterium]
MDHRFGYQINHSPWTGVPSAAVEHVSWQAEQLYWVSFLDPTHFDCGASKPAASPHLGDATRLAPRCVACVRRLHEAYLK